MQLLAIDGYLHLPLAQPNADGETSRLLLLVYGAGDCDAVRWPFENTPFTICNEQISRLATCLYDEVQTGGIDEACEITLPDTRIFADYKGGPNGLLLRPGFADAVKAHHQAVAAQLDENELSQRERRDWMRA